MVIWKQELKGGSNLVRIPTGSRFVSFGKQDFGIVVWYIAPQTRDFEDRLLIVVNTGQSFYADATYLGTVQLEEDYVKHILEVPTE